MAGAFGDIAELVVVVRMPKSASTSLSAMALQAFPDRTVLVLPNTLDPDGELSMFQRLRYVRHAARSNLRAYRLLRLSRVFERINQTPPATAILTGGHIDFETCRKKIAHKLKLVTIVRNPVDRSLSEYVYARAGYARKAPLAKFDASLVCKAAGRYSYEGFLDYLLERRAAFADIACRYIGWEPAADIDQHFADNVFHFGVVDNLHGFATGLSRKTGRDIRVEHLNSSPRVLERALSAAERRKIEELYANDFMLYEWCRTHDSAAHHRPKPTHRHREPRHGQLATQN